MTSTPAKTQLLDALRQADDVLAGPWHERATVLDLVELCSVHRADDKRKVFYVLTWVSAFPNLSSWPERATDIQSHLDLISLQCPSQKRELCKTLLYIGGRQPEESIRQEMDEKMRELGGQDEAFKEADRWFSMRFLPGLIAKVEAFRHELEVGQDLRSSNDAGQSDDSVLSPAHDRLLKRFKSKRKLHISGKYAFLFATAEHDVLASRLAVLPASRQSDAIFQKVAREILGIDANLAPLHDWNKYGTTYVNAKMSPRYRPGRWTDWLCIVWACVPFCSLAADGFETAWWSAASYAEAALLEQDAEKEPQATDTLYLITHLVYVANAYMTLDLDKHKAKHLRENFLTFVQTYIQDRFLEQECKIDINNIELLVELADFLRAIGRHVPDELDKAFRALTTSDLDSWLENLSDNLEGAAHVLFLFNRRLAPRTSHSRRVKMKELFGRAYSKAQPEPVTNPVVNYGYGLRKRKPLCTPTPDVDQCHSRHRQEMDCPKLPEHGCINQRVRMRRWAPTHIAPSTVPNAGQGVFASQLIKAGEFLAEYTGKVFGSENP